MLHFADARSVADAVRISRCIGLAPGEVVLDGGNLPVGRENDRGIICGEFRLGDRTALADFGGGRTSH